MAFTRAVRVLIWVVILIPKFFICVYLGLMGGRWLFASTSLQDLILNSLALAFILDIDGLLFKALFPEKMSDKISGITFAPPDLSDHSTASNHREVMISYVRSFIFLVCSIAAVAVYFMFQQALPGYDFLTDDIHTACHAADVASSLVCQPFEQDCFPYGR